MIITISFIKIKIYFFIFELWVDIKINYLYYEFCMQKQLKKTYDGCKPNIILDD